MALTMPHLKYLLAISEAAREYPDVSSRLIADALEVSKPSVVKILNILMEKDLIVKEHYGKIYLTDRGAFTVRYYSGLLSKAEAAMPDFGFDLSAEQRRDAALAMVAALPAQDYRLRYRDLFGHWPEEREILLDADGKM